MNNPKNLYHMKTRLITNLKVVSMLAFVFLFAATSCQKEEILDNTNAQNEITDQQDVLVDPAQWTHGENYAFETEVLDISYLLQDEPHIMEIMCRDGSCCQEERSMYLPGSTVYFWMDGDKLMAGSDRQVQQDITLNVLVAPFPIVPREDMYSNMNEEEIRFTL
jgi:hypothetical protein